MIGHQAICPDRDLLCAAELRHELEVVLVIFLTEERLLSAVSPLGDMVGHARSYHTCRSSHGGKLNRPQPSVKSYVWCPRNSLLPGTPPWGHPAPPTPLGFSGGHPFVAGKPKTGPDPAKPVHHCLTPRPSGSKHQFNFGVRPARGISPYYGKSQPDFHAFGCRLRDGVKGDTQRQKKLRFQFCRNYGH